MLGKLIKHEWKAVWKFLTALNVFMLIMTLVGSLGMMFMSMFDGRGTVYSSAAETIWGVLTTTYVSTYFLGLIVVVIGIMIYLGIRFYKSMYGDEGYLTHTLPVTSLQLITAKAIVAVLSHWITYLVLIFSVITLAVSGNIFLADDPITMTDFFRVWAEAKEYFEASGFTFLNFVLPYILTCIIASFGSLFMMYGAISLGQLLNKHRILSSVGIYFGFSMVTQIFSTLGFGIAFSSTRLIMVEEDLSRSNEFLSYTGSTALIYGSLIISVITAVGFFLLTWLLTKKKLNLE